MGKYRSVKGILVTLAGPFRHVKTHTEMEMAMAMAVAAAVQNKQKEEGEEERLETKPQVFPHYSPHARYAVVRRFLPVYYVSFTVLGHNVCVCVCDKLHVICL